MEQALTIDRPLASFLPERLGAAHRMVAEHWLGRSAGAAPTSTNQDAQELPFQRWYRFKEAFAPRAVVDAITALDQQPATCTDPFGGSGTTALTCQFLGIRPTTIEVNPFLADLIEAKLSRYDVTALMADYRETVDRAWASRPDPSQAMIGAPPTFFEPGVNGRWIFSIEVASQILAFRLAIDALPDRKHARVLRVLLGSVLISCSNVVISGKGRRYRSGWSKRSVTRADVARLFEGAFIVAVEDICRYGPRPCGDYTLLRGDARKILAEAPPSDLALFSPPYPNSFDYTDIYNVELWMLGYLRNRDDNRALRESTFRSHVQIKRCYSATISSPLLREVVERLGAKRSQLWDAEIPDMVAAYFDDLATVLSGLWHAMRPGASVMMVVGDSRYADVSIDVGAISTEMAATLGYRLVERRPMRSMRSSAQQGGRFELGETLIHLTRE
ncbi:MAG TPA: hypothetical protein VIJ94_01010 [Caulobacteraceae bacterium]